MNKVVLLKIGIPLNITNKEGRNATIKLNKDEFVICDFGRGENYYLNDVNLVGWYPKNRLSRLRYRYYSKAN